MTHLMMYGMTACLMTGQPKSWPEDHRWTTEWADVTCPICLDGKGDTRTYDVAADGKSITCLRCKKTSHNENDVKHHFCGHCHVFHDDLWPPARRAWLNKK